MSSIKDELVIHKICNNTFPDVGGKVVTLGFFFVLGEQCEMGIFHCCPNRLMIKSSKNCSVAFIKAVCVVSTPPTTWASFMESPVSMVLSVLTIPWP